MECNICRCRVNIKIFKHFPSSNDQFKSFIFPKYKRRLEILEIKDAQDYHPQQQSKQLISIQVRVNTSDFKYDLYCLHCNNSFILYSSQNFHYCDSTRGPYTESHKFSQLCHLKKYFRLPLNDIGLINKENKL